MFVVFIEKILYGHKSGSSFPKKLQLLFSSVCKQGNFTHINIYTKTPDKIGTIYGVSFSFSVEKTGIPELMGQLYRWDTTYAKQYYQYLPIAIKHAF